MRRVIISGVSGDLATKMAAISWPAMERYADAHGCEFRGVTLRDFGRHPSWSKLLVIAEALVKFDEVLWLDADVAVVDASRSIFDDFQDGFPHAMCYVPDADGNEHFNCGVWALRLSAVPLLVAAAMSVEQTQWHEQTAVNGLLSEFPPCVMPNEWNWWIGDWFNPSPRFRHACGFTGDTQLAMVRGWLS